MDTQATPYQGLSPERILRCVEAAGYRCNGQLLALNSCENRVYQVGLEDGPRWWSSSTGRGAGAMP